MIGTVHFDLFKFYSMKNNINSADGRINLQSGCHMRKFAPMAYGTNIPHFKFRLGFMNKK